MSQRVKGEYPWSGSFRTKEQVDDYLSGSEIECLLCGRALKAVGGRHLKRIHGISIDEYKRRFGIPWCRGLVCKKTSEKYAAGCKRRISFGNLDPVAMAALRKSYKSQQRESVGYVKELNRKKFLAAVAKAAAAAAAKRNQKGHTKCQE